MGVLEDDRDYWPSELVIERVSQGGYIVWPAPRADGYRSSPLYACADIEPALSFIRGRLAR